MDALILHLAPALRWQSWPVREPYLPAEYARDGFIHLTAGREMLLYVANSFYRASPEPFVVLAVDPARLTAELRWEPGSHGEATLFPHLYGPLNRDAVVAVFPMQRTPEGLFLGF